jgi:uncharacterized protein (TIGR03084 family)
MQATCGDLLDEYQALAALCETLTPVQWQLRSTFFGWTPWDEIAHLCYFDETALLSATDADAFASGMKALGVRLASGEQISAIARATYGHLDGAALTARWRQLHEQLVAALRPLDPKARLPWYGPSMSARSFATARLMETWAHGQDIWDVIGRQRPATARLKHIAHIGVTTFGWSFVNRKLVVPSVVPYIALDAPDGTLWTWGEPSQTDWVRGSAQNFCLLVTQRRHRADTRIECKGAAAEQWLSIAQCFAGPPAEPPAPGAYGLAR